LVPSIVLRFNLGLDLIFVKEEMRGRIGKATEGWIEGRMAPAHNRLTCGGWSSRRGPGGARIRESPAEFGERYGMWVKDLDVAGADDLGYAR